MLQNLYKGEIIMICKKEDCTGCFACYNICPKNAINMKEDEYGYIYQVLN